MNYIYNVDSTLFEFEYNINVTYQKIMSCYSISLLYILLIFIMFQVDRRYQ